MKSRRFALFSSLIFGLLASSLGWASVGPVDPESKVSWPDQPIDLPAYARKVRDYGERAELSHDAKRLLYVTKAGGEVEELDLQTGTVTRITDFPRPEGMGFYRAYYLANGDYLLTGGYGRSGALFWVVPADRTKAPTMLLEPVQEGAAVSRKDMKLAWMANAQQIFVGELAYGLDGKPFIKDRRIVVFAEQSLKHIPEYAGRETYIEPQNFLPSDPNILTFTHYAKKPYSAEVLTVNLATGEIVHQTPGVDLHGEPEGAWPGGPWTFVETGALMDPERDGGIDLTLLKLDGTGKTLVRATYLTRGARVAFTNPCVSDDGRWVACQLANNHVAGPGAGRGIYLIDLNMALSAVGVTLER